MARRAFEIGIVGVSLICLLPLWLLIGLAIKLDDGGPIFYSQWRVGQNFRLFRLLKFRTMISGADRLAPLTAAKDARITRAGKFLRRYKLDELPQLVNVLKGDMQLVGSRPELLRYVEIFRDQYAQILRHRPGITDPATLAYHHEEEMFDAEAVEERYIADVLPRKLEMSLLHSQERSFVSDAGILIRTIFSLAPRPLRPDPTARERHIPNLSGSLPTPALTANSELSREHETRV